MCALYICSFYAASVLGLVRTWALSMGGWVEEEAALRSRERTPLSMRVLPMLLPLGQTGWTELYTRFKIFLSTVWVLAILCIFREDLYGSRLVEGFRSEQWSLVSVASDGKPSPENCHRPYLARKVSLSFISSLRFFGCPQPRSKLPSSSPKPRRSISLECFFPQNLSRPASHFTSH